MMDIWCEVSQEHPPPHEKYVVFRDGFIFTATPCYGLHAPLWVVRLMPDKWPNEADPVPMKDDDKWAPLSSVVAIGKGWVSPEQAQAMRAEIAAFVLSLWAERDMCSCKQEPDGWCSRCRRFAEQIEKAGTHGKSLLAEREKLRAVAEAARAVEQRLRQDPFDMATAMALGTALNAALDALEKPSVDPHQG